MICVQQQSDSFSVPCVEKKMTVLAMQQIFRFFNIWLIILSPLFSSVPFFSFSMQHRRHRYCCFFLHIFINVLVVNFDDNGTIFFSSINGFIFIAVLSVCLRISNDEATAIQSNVINLADTTACFVWHNDCELRCCEYAYALCTHAKMWWKWQRNIMSEYSRYLIYLSYNFYARCIFFLFSIKMLFFLPAIQGAVANRLQFRSVYVVVVVVVFVYFFPTVLAISLCLSHVGRSWDWMRKDIWDAIFFLCMRVRVTWCDIVYTWSTLTWIKNHIRGLKREITLKKKKLSGWTHPNWKVLFSVCEWRRPCNRSRAWCE